MLLFDADGAFVSAATHHQKGTEVAAENLPATITAYIAANYSGATVEKAVQDSAGSYVVVIKKTDETFTGLSFDADGAITSELSLQEGGFGCGGGHKEHKSTSNADS